MTDIEQVIVPGHSLSNVDAAYFTALLEQLNVAAATKICGPTLDAQGALQEISKNTFYFIKTGALVVGTAAYCLRPDKRVYISNVAVNPTYRRQGIARAAMSFILEKCKGAYRIDLVTHPENKNALRLYASLGFKVESRSENFFGDGGPRLLLALMPPRFALPAMQAAGSAIFCGFL